MVNGLNIAIIPGGNEYLNNKIFQADNLILNRDNCHDYLIMFKENMEHLGHKVGTYDVFRPEDINLLIVYRIDFMISHYLKVMRKNNHCAVFYMMTEPPIISQLHHYEQLKEFDFNKIFTWNDDEIPKSDKIIKLNYLNPKINPYKIPSVAFREKKLMATVIGRKKSNFPNELYTERLKVVKYFSAQKEHFSLYGRGWDKDKRSWIKNLWKGEIDNKNKVLRNYKYTLCFENSAGYNGYITEKIFDAFASGSVPVYYGAKNITHYIPTNTFIDYSLLRSPEKLYSFLENIDERTYNEYLSNTKNFLNSSKYEQFCSISYSKILTTTIEDIKQTKKRNYLKLRLMLVHGLFKKCKIFKYIKRYVFEVLLDF